ncbi:MAG: threonine/serine exporter family protein, partial [Phascolarctobacterium sp.]|nr:threonine/serine exporter family protein [Phascolarctobacterium sp.]
MSLTNLNRKQTLDIAMVVGKVLLKSGAETSRVEDTIERFCNRNHCYGVNVFVTPTVIVLGDEQPDGYCCVSRIRSRSTNLRTVSQI